MICAGYPWVGGKGPCNGDSGGPFVCNDDGNAVIAGVVSWGPNPCALKDYPAVYARTTSALSWIQNSMVSFYNSYKFTKNGIDVKINSVLIRDHVLELHHPTLLPHPH